ncbi:hypothetical protein M0D21_16975 [Aquimarina sp. D1M17]|uniref:SnoaL-like domain-containing protein n=1 Tax=Aquimarina acroporae TaxID=2937283 RepID=UPI0020BD57E8|nr:SnoaL-like domain-containing protein [Aquimarina acroporae]MCK8523276.1 hypothetical protein [Aquimarina acroporae]
MTTTIATAVVALLREKKFLEAQKQWFAEDAINQEPEAYQQKSVSGLKAMMQKEKNFLSIIKQWNHFQVSDPLIAKDHFSIHMVTDVTLVNDQRVAIDEIIVYEVNDQKITKEQFFYL